MLWNWRQPLDGVIQTAFIVKDLDEAMPRFARALNIGPWYVARHFGFQSLTYRGQPSELDISLCLAFSGGMMYELIEQHGEAPSPYTETRDSRGYGFHHWGVAATPTAYNERSQALSAQGYQVVIEGVTSVGSRLAYCEASPSLGGMIEIIEITPLVEALFTVIQQASDQWNGQDPVRDFPTPS